MKIRLGLLIAMVTCICPLSRALQTVPTFVANTPVMEQPLDLAITDAGKYAIVRTGRLSGANLGHTYFTNLTSFTTTSFSDPADGLSVDYIATIDDYCITTGGFDATSIYDLSANPITQIFTTPCASVDVVTAYHPTTGNALGIIQGYGDGVTGGLGINIFDLSATPAPTVVSALVPIFNSGTSPSSYGNATFLSDAVQASGSRAIAITNRVQPVAGGGTQINEGYVGITDFDAAHTITLGFSCSPTIACTLAHPNEELHDVAVTPDRVHAIVSGNGVLGVYNLAREQQRYRVIDHALPHMRSVQPPLSQVTVDSVEATNTRAVIIGKDVQNTNNNDPLPTSPTNEVARWRVAIVQLDGPAGSQYAHWVYNDTSGIQSRAHDVAITPNGAKAIVTTRRDTLIFDLTVKIDAAGPAICQTATDPLQYPLLGLQYAAFVSDSVATTNTQAVVIGRAGPGLTSGARICMIDLLAPGTPSFAAFSFPDTTVPATYWLPTEVAIDKADKFAVVRMVNIANLTAPNTSGRVVVIDLTTKSVVLDQQAAMGSPLGIAQGYDQVECSYDRVITAGELLHPTTGTLPQGWLQILTL